MFFQGIWANFYFFIFCTHFLSYPRHYSSFCNDTNQQLFGVNHFFTFVWNGGCEPERVGQ